MVKQLELAELIAAKFSHDITGPIGAVNNGVEFLAEEDANIREKAIDLLQQSAKEAVARLQLFRYAYGISKQPGEADFGQLRQLLEQYFKFGKVKVNWQVSYDPATAAAVLGHRFGKLFVNLILISAASLMHGGTVNVTLHHNTPDKSVVLDIVAEGKTVRIDPEVYEMLCGSENTESLVTPRNVHVFYSRQLANALNMALMVENTDTKLHMNSVYIGG